MHSLIVTGLIHVSRPIFSTQFHPEAKGGPLDSSYLFDMYMENVLKYKNGLSATSPLRDSKPSPLLVDLLAKERVGVDLPEGVKNVMAAQGLAGESAPLPLYAAGTS